MQFRHSSLNPFYFSFLAKRYHYLCKMFHTDSGTIFLIWHSMLKPPKEYYQNNYRYIATVLMKVLSQVCMKHSMREIRKINHETYLTECYICLHVPKCYILYYT